MKTGLGRGHRRSFGSRQAQPTPLPLQAFVFLPFSKDINLLSILNNHPAVFRHPAHFSPFLHPCWEQTNLFLSAIFFFYIPKDCSCGLPTTYLVLKSNFLSLFIHFLRATAPEISNCPPSPPLALFQPVPSPPEAEVQQKATLNMPFALKMKD